MSYVMSLTIDLYAYMSYEPGCCIMFVLDEV